MGLIILRCFLLLFCGLSLSAQASQREPARVLKALEVGRYHFNQNSGGGLVLGAYVERLGLSELPKRILIEAKKMQDLRFGVESGYRGVWKVSEVFPLQESPARIILDGQTFYFVGTRFVNLGRTALWQEPLLYFRVFNEEGHALTDAAGNVVLVNPSSEAKSCRVVLD